MKTALRTVALCLLVSNVRGFANDDLTKQFTDCVLAAAKLYVGWVIIQRTIEVAEYATEKVSDAAPSAVGTVLDYTVKPVLNFADAKKPLAATFGCAGK